jgi:hypothetical protein
MTLRMQLPLVSVGKKQIFCVPEREDTLTRRLSV